MKGLYLFILLICALFMSSSCEKDYSYEGGAAAPVSSNAVYTFVGAPNVCTAATQNGIFINGTPTNKSNTITIQVNVTVAGNYSITTAIINGVSFSGTG